MRIYIGHNLVMDENENKDEGKDNETTERDEIE